ncbi:MAG: hypothetical protein LBT89_04990 [Planctomycetaceae bacterium]|nr:hypothetical protein [Planctomycetaceae bacterium]
MENTVANKTLEKPLTLNKGKQKMESKAKAQKEALFKLLQTQFGTENVEREKPFQWWDDTEGIPAEYQTIYNALVAYRGIPPVVKRRMLSAISSSKMTS